MIDRALLEEKFKDEAFVKELFSQKTAEDAQACFEKNGVSLTLDEVKEAGEALGKLAKGEIKAEDVEKFANGELSEEELSQAAGGFMVTTGMIVAACVIGAAGGTGGTIAAIKYSDEIIDWFRSW